MGRTLNKTGDADALLDFLSKPHKRHCLSVFTNLQLACRANWLRSNLVFFFSGCEVRRVGELALGHRGEN